ncbi:TetR/AcrR family transcriptional regulator [Nonomuraea sp. NPDC050556]|uniref:TetR/AcrR family transcriptional regulator n=1 Tax=Nonomuraea sp. NPDC050556 TaxID=3364369 RepID=UPI0037938593
MTGTASGERGRMTRQRLFDAAVALIGEAGWGNVTTRMVAERAGVAPGVVHYHFASVSDLLVAASCAYAESMLAAMGAQLAEQQDVDGGIDWLLAMMSEYAGSDPAALLIVEMYLASGRLPELRDRLGAMVRTFRAVVAAWLRARGHTDGADATATVLAAAVDGLILQYSLDPGLDVAALATPLRALVRLS